MLCLEAPCPKEELVEITLQDDVLKVDGNMGDRMERQLKFYCRTVRKDTARFGSFGGRTCKCVSWNRKSSPGSSAGWSSIE